MTGPALNFADSAAVAAWLADLRSCFADIDAVVRDMLSPPWKRELGPMLHAEHYNEAHDAIRETLAFASAGLPTDPDATPTTPDDDVPPWEERDAS